MRCERQVSLPLWVLRRRTVVPNSSELRELLHPRFVLWRTQAELGGVFRLVAEGAC